MVNLPFFAELYSDRDVLRLHSLLLGKVDIYEHARFGVTYFSFYEKRETNPRRQPPVGFCGRNSRSLSR